MKLKILTSILLLLTAFAINAMPTPDILSPPDPPSSPDSVMGPTLICIGETAMYHADTPVGCICLWSLNGNPQTTSDCWLEIIWQETGLQVVGVSYQCNGGPPSAEKQLEVMVLGTPAQPLPINGDPSICEYSSHTYTTTVGPYDSCEWSVDGNIQPGIYPIMSYDFGGPGTYHIEVKAYNNCGISIARELDVVAIGTAPDLPSPIEGPEISCKNNSETYSTTVDPGESCRWAIDYVVQTETSTTLNVDWLEPGFHLVEARAVTDCGTGNPVYLEVEVLEDPYIDLGPDTVINQGETLTLDAGNPGCSYLWTTGETSQSIIVNAAGTYGVSVSNFCGDDYDEIIVDIFVGIQESDPCRNAKIYSNSGHLIFDCGDTRIQHLKIFSLTGQLIFEGSPQSEIILKSPALYLILYNTPDGWFSRKLMAQ